MRRQLAELMPVEGDPARVGLEHATHTVEERRLTGAVGPDEPDDLPGIDPKGSVVERGDPAEADGDVFHLEQRSRRPRHVRTPSRTSTCSETSTSSGSTGARPAARCPSRCLSLCWKSVTIPSGVTMSCTMSSAPVTRLNHCGDTFR